MNLLQEGLDRLQPHSEQQTQKADDSALVAVDKKLGKAE